jgi:GAF domain-containing protein
MPASPLHLLAVNLEPTLIAVLAGRAFAVEAVEGEAVALTRVPAFINQFDVALAHADNSAIVASLKLDWPHLPVVVLAPDAARGVEALRRGADRYVLHPADIDELELALCAAGEQNRRYAAERRRREIADVLSHIPQIINETLALEEVVDLILEQLPRVVAYDSASIQLLRPAAHDRDSVLEIVADRGLDDQPNALRGLTFPLDPERHPNALVLQTHTPHVEADAPARYPAFLQPEFHAGHIRSWLGAPLIYRQRTIGVLSIDKREPNYYGPDDAELALTFANQAAIAIANAQLYQAAEQRTATLETLLEVGQTLATRTVEDPGLVLQTIVEGAGRVTGADCVVIYPYDSEKQSYDSQLVRAVGVREPLAPRDTPRSAAGLSMSVVAKGRLIVEDVEADAGLREAKFNQREGIRSFAAVSLVAGDTPVGVLFVNYRSRHRFTPDEDKLIELFANQAAVAIANSRLHHKVYVNLSRYVHELEEKFKLMSTIIAIQDNLDLEAVLTRVLDRALSITNARHGWISFLNEQGSDYQVRAARGQRKQEDQPWASLFGTLTGLAVAKARTLVVEDVIDSQWANVRVDWLTQMRSGLVVPLLENRTPIGFITVTGEQPGAFTLPQAQELERLAPEIVLAVRNARAYSQAQEEIKNLDRLLHIGPLVLQPLRLQDTLNAIITQAVQALPDVDILTLYYKDEAQHTIRLAGAYGIRSARLSHTRTQDNNVVARVMAERQTIIAPDARSEPRLAGRFVVKEQVVSTVAVPLVAGEHVVGAMFVSYRKRHAFQEREVHLINLFAAYAAAAIDRAWQYEALARHQNQLVALREASAAIAFSLHVEDILTTILKQAQLLTRARYCTYQRLEGDTLVFVQTAPPEKLAELQRLPGNIPITHGVTGRAVRERTPIYIANTADEPDYLPPEDAPSYAELAIPLMDGAACLGVLNLELDEPGLDKDLQALMTTLADDAVIALRNARLYEQAQRRAEIFDRLRRLSLDITSDLDLMRVLESVVLGAVDVLDADIATIFVVERTAEQPLETLTDDTQYTGLMCDRGRVSRADPARSPKASGLAAQVFRTQRPAVVHNVENEPLLRDSRVVRERGLCSLVCAPLRSGERVLGVLYVDHCRPYHFSDDDVQTIELFAAQAALAVQNAQRYRALENARDRAFATEAVAWMGLIGSEWTHAINQKTFGFATYLKGLELLAQRLEAEAAGQLRLGLAGIQATAESIRQVPLPRAEGGREVKEPTPVDEVIEQLVRQWARPHPNIRLEFRLRCPGVAVHIELQWFKVALEKLVSNALRALNGKGQLTLGSERAGHRVRITIHDTGPGLPDYAREHFLKQRIEKPRDADQTGTGAGVLIAQFILMNHNGSLELNYSNAERGTELMMTLPVSEAQ